MKRDSVHRHLSFQQEHNKSRAGPGVQGKEWAAIIEPRWEKISQLCKSREAELAVVPSQTAGLPFHRVIEGESSKSPLTPSLTTFYLEL